jgi:excinuclease UvrABC nuclease subunit
MLAKTLRDKKVLDLISTDPGVYRWYMPQSLVDQLNIPIEGCDYKNDYGYFVYVGIAKNMRQRLDWHISQKHSKSSVRSGFLSTLRQTLCGLARVPMDDEQTVNTLIDQMSIEFIICSSKDDAESIEKEIIHGSTLPLNIMHNKHPFVKELKRLRGISKRLESK